MKTKFGAILLTASLSLGNPAVAGEGDHEAHGGTHAGVRGPAGGMAMHGLQDPERMVRHISSWLELDEAQSQELSNVMLSAKPQLMALREKARVNREAIAALDGSDSEYGTKIRSLAIENGQIATEMTLLVSQLRVDIHSKLTAEQRQMLAEGGDRMRQRWRSGRRASDDKTQQ